MAQCDIHASELLVAIPEAAQVRAPTSHVGFANGTKEMAVLSPLCPQLGMWAEQPESAGGAAEWHLDVSTMQLVLRLLEERRQDASSSWATYIPTIPKSYPAILWDEGRQRRCLGGTPDEAHIARRFTRQAAERRLLQRCKVENTLEWASTADLDVVDGANLKHDVREVDRDVIALRWALHSVGSRSYEKKVEPQGSEQESGKSTNHARPRPAMVPFADLFNDSPSPNAQWRWHGSDASTFEIVAGTKGIADGAEVTISYGSKTSEQLLTHYGFAHPDNPLDIANLDLLDESAALSPQSQSSRLALSFDAGTSAGWLPRTLSALRFHFSMMERPSNGQGAASDTKQEAAMLALIQKRCSEAQLQWADEQFKNGTGPDLTIDEGKGACDVYRASLSSLARSCVDFASLASAELSRQGQGSLRIDGAKLADRLLAAWRSSITTRVPLQYS